MHGNKPHGLMGNIYYTNLRGTVRFIPHIMLRDLLTQKCAQKLILDTPVHVDLENIKLKIGQF
jgi:hypothetical protein